MLEFFLLRVTVIERATLWYRCSGFEDRCPLSGVRVGHLLPHTVPYGLFLTRTSACFFGVTGDLQHKRMASVNFIKYLLDPYAPACPAVHHQTTVSHLQGKKQELVLPRAQIVPCGGNRPGTKPKPNMKRWRGGCHILKRSSLAAANLLGTYLKKEGNLLEKAVLASLKCEC